ncbi:LmbE family N-acetylglucosaminyl deacetylase [Kibdelosporangium banguiense]|uniref:LmbE family N-acetylglucosaminyl deacetylase n=1 Tax=Kibdelosporangium banguiense TaxID=1365924 RepID=A0ABS4TCZ0_9PSEU|nr:PIG-L family deacetylase [Kibdelosporangium banguiense]MBP2322287.1 LmbE family N-acetylglucosaminyl deacetylase [Kibdelosporangium banguiense]
MGVRYFIALVVAAVLVGCGAVPERQPAEGVRYVQVVAHADDDVIFMNPDLASGIRAGQATTGVYLTAGETDKADAEAYAARRQAGTRAAYARMAGVPDEWDASRLDVDARHAVELYTLRARPQVKVVFVNLPENNDPRAAGGRAALVRLWRDDRDNLRVRTLVPTGGVVTRPYFYTHEDVVELLVKLFDRFQPTVVRAQDPDPDKRYAKDWPGFHDHPDHIMAARFTEEASQRYLGPRFVLENYRDYNVAEEPVNLSPADQKDKNDFFSAYVPHDSDVSMGHPYNGWLPRMYRRFPRGSTWTADDKAYVVFKGRLFYWDSAWHALPWAGGRLAPAVSVTGGQVVGKRLPDNDIVTLVNGSWVSLGNPGQNTPGDPSQTGSPVATTEAVYVKNGRGGLSRWDGRKWNDIGGSDIQDGLAVAGDSVYASTRDKVIRWRAGFQDAEFKSGKPAGPPAAAMTVNGPVVAYRTETGDIEVITNGQIKVLAGLPGSGNPTVAADGSIFARTAAGGLAVNSGNGWRDLGGQVFDQPAPMGRGVIALGPDGQFHKFSGP